MMEEMQHGLGVLLHVAVYQSSIHVAAFVDHMVRVKMLSCYSLIPVIVKILIPQVRITTAKIIVQTIPFTNSTSIDIFAACSFHVVCIAQ